MIYLRRAALRVTLANTSSSTEQQLQERMAMAEIAHASETEAVAAVDEVQALGVQISKEAAPLNGVEVLHLSLNRRPIKYTPVALQSTCFESGLFPPCRAGGSATVSISALKQALPSSHPLASTTYPGAEGRGNNDGRSDAVLAAARRAQGAWLACQHPKPCWAQVPLSDNWLGTSNNSTTRTRSLSSSSTLSSKAQHGSSEERGKLSRGVVDGWYMSVFPSAATVGGRTGVENKSGPLVGGGIATTTMATSNSSSSSSSGTTSSNSSPPNGVLARCRSFQRPRPPPYFDRIPPPEDLEPPPTLLDRVRGGSIDVEDKSSKSAAKSATAGAGAGAFSTLGGGESSPSGKLSKRMSMKAAGSVTSSLLGSFRSSKKGRSDNLSNDDDSNSSSLVSPAAAAAGSGTAVAAKAASPLSLRSSRIALSAASAVASPKSSKKAKGGNVLFQGAAAASKAPPPTQKDSASSSSASSSSTLYEGQLAPPVAACGWGHGRHLAGWPAHSSLQPRRAWWQPSVSDWGNDSRLRSLFDSLLCLLHTAFSRYAIPLEVELVTFSLYCLCVLTIAFCFLCVYIY